MGKSSETDIVAVIKKLGNWRIDELTHWPIGIWASSFYTRMETTFSYVESLKDVKDNFYTTKIISLEDLLFKRLCQMMLKWDTKFAI